MLFNSMDQIIKYYSQHMLNIKWVLSICTCTSIYNRYIIRQQTIDDSVLSELIMHNVSRNDGGIYYCRAGNIFGSDQLSIILNVQEPPSAPINIRLIEQSSRSIHISWSSEAFNGNSPLLKYIIQYKFPSDTWNPDEIIELNIPSSTTNARLESLTPSTTYYIRILAQNNIGISSPSELIQVTTSEEIPERPPIHLQIQPLSSSKLKIDWDPPDKKFWHGVILGYYLGYKELGPALLLGSNDNNVEDDEEEDEENLRKRNYHGSLSSSSSDNSESNMNGFHFRTVEVGIDFSGSAILDNLNPYTKYLIITQAFNSQGHGPSSTPMIGATLQDVPSMSPESIHCKSTSSSSLGISWEDPPLEGRHGLIQGFKLKYQALTNDDVNIDELRDINNDNNIKLIMSKSTVLYGLYKWTNYSINVLAFTTIGDGVWSKGIICQTDEDVPLPPSNIKALVSSRHSIHISWLPPIQSNGIIINYTLYFKGVDSSSSKIEKKHFQAFEHSYIVTNLKENQRYEFWMSCSTKVGEGPSTSRTRATTSNKIPARITSFSRSIQIPWKKQLTLNCNAVGVPEPSIFWEFNGQYHIQHGPRKHINGGGSILTLQELGLDDAGNYSCTISNAHGTDSIMYNVQVQVPPLPPTLSIHDSSYDSITLNWKLENNGGASIKGFMIHFKKSDDGDWEELELEPGATTKSSSEVSTHNNNNHVHVHVLHGLTCGSKYQLYLTAANKIGTGLPSQIIIGETKGNSPTPPKKNEILSGNSSSIIIKLSSWSSIGCPIIKYIIEYKQGGSTKNSNSNNNNNVNWIRLLPNEFNGDTKLAFIHGLVPSTKYNLRITAENPAGKSTANYNFITSSSSTNSLSSFHGPGRGIGLISNSDDDEENSDDDHDNVENGDEDKSSNSAVLTTSLLIVFPSILSFIAMTSVIGILCYYRKKRLEEEGYGPKNVFGDSSAGLQFDSQLLSRGGSGGGGGTCEPRYCPVKTNEPRDNDGGLRYKAVDSAGYVEDVCPYATFQLPDKAPSRPMLIGNNKRGNSKKKSSRNNRGDPTNSTFNSQQGVVHHTGDTLYTTGNIYSGPYHSVQSGATGVGIGTFHYNQAATMQLREPDYARVRNTAHGIEIESQESDVDINLTNSNNRTTTDLSLLQHMPSQSEQQQYDHDTLGSDSEDDCEVEKYIQTPSHKHKSCHHHQQHPGLLPSSAMLQYNQSQTQAQHATPYPPHTQEMVTFRQKQRSGHGMMTSEHDDDDNDDSQCTSSDEEEDEDESSPANTNNKIPRANYKSGTTSTSTTNYSYISNTNKRRKKRCKNKSTASTKSSHGCNRLRSSSGYSTSHTNIEAETSFNNSSVMYDHIQLQPPRRFSDYNASKDLSSQNDDDNSEDEVILPDNKPSNTNIKQRPRRKPATETASAAAVEYHIHV